MGGGRVGGLWVPNCNGRYGSIVNVKFANA